MSRADYLAAERDRARDNYKELREAVKALLSELDAHDAVRYLDSAGQEALDHVHTVLGMHDTQVST